MELVEVENLSYSYPGREEPALREVDLVLYPGEFVLLAGGSGSGKSTLCRAINGLVPHFYGGRLSGRVAVSGKDTVETPVRELSTRVGMVFQDPENQLVTESPVSEVAFGLENLGLDRGQMRKRVEEVLATLRLSPLKGKRVSELSGGQKQKVALASVLAMHPDVLVLDEPTSQLDPISAEDFLATVKALNDDLGLSVLLAEHRLERCFHFADRVLVLDEGRLVFNGTPAGMAAWADDRQWVPLPPITRLFLGRNAAAPPLTVKEGRERVRSLLDTEPGAPSDRIDDLQGETVEVTNQESKTLVRTQGLWHVYEDGTIALRGVDLSISEGEAVGVIGENGSGKTTLVKHFNGLLRPSRGRVRVLGEDTRDKEVAELAKTCGMLGQNPNNQLITEVVEEELLLSLEAIGTPEQDRDMMVDEALRLLELESFGGENPRDLSCGERERVALASVLVYQPRLLVLDEPTRGIDQETKSRIAGYLREYHSRGNTVVVVTHDLEFAASCCERVILMGGGEILADGDKHEVLSGSLFFTTQFNKSFRGTIDGVVTEEEAMRALEVLS